MYVKPLTLFVGVCDGGSQKVVEMYEPAPDLQGKTFSTQDQSITPPPIPLHHALKPYSLVQGLTPVVFVVCRSVCAARVVA